MPHNIPIESLAADEPFTWKDCLQSLGIAVLLVSAVIVIVGFLVTPGPPR